MMAKKKVEVAPAPRKNAGTSVTLARKAKRVLQSSGLQYFLQWADKDTTGGRRKKAARSKFKTDNPRLYKELLAKGERLNRKMDRPKPKEEKSEE
jgi:hypothetical protein